MNKSRRKRIWKQLRAIEEAHLEIESLVMEESEAAERCTQQKAYEEGQRNTKLLEKAHEELFNAGESLIQCVKKIDVEKEAWFNHMEGPSS